MEARSLRSASPSSKKLNALFERRLNICRKRINKFLYPESFFDALSCTHTKSFTKFSVSDKFKDRVVKRVAIFWRHRNPGLPINVYFRNSGSQIRVNNSPPARHCFKLNNAK